MNRITVVSLIIFIFFSCNRHDNNLDIENQNIKTGKQNNENVQPFYFEDEFIKFNSVINDSIKTKVILETGCKDLKMDIEFFNKYFDKGQKKVLNVLNLGFSMQQKKDTSFTIKDTRVNIKIGDKHIEFFHFEIFDFRKYNLNADILLPIPINDTNDIWELNIEGNFIKLVEQNNFNLPNGYISVPIQTSLKNYIPNDIIFYLPIQYMSDQNEIERDTLFCLFDTGNGGDVFLWNSIDVINKLKKQKLLEGIFNDNIADFYFTRASFFNFNIFDRASIRFFKEPKSYPIYNIVGLNFIIRFNYFFDLKNKIIFLKQINNPKHIFFKSGYSFVGGYGHYTKDLNLVIDSIGEKFSHFPLPMAGLIKDDTIIWFCGRTMKETKEKSLDFRDLLQGSQYYHLKVIRNGDTIDLKADKMF